MKSTCRLRRRVPAWFAQVPHPPGQQGASSGGPGRTHHWANKRLRSGSHKARAMSSDTIVRLGGAVADADKFAHVQVQYTPVFDGIWSSPYPPPSLSLRGCVHDWQAGCPPKKVRKGGSEGVRDWGTPREEKQKRREKEEEEEEEKKEQEEDKEEEKDDDDDSEEEEEAPRALTWPARASLPPAARPAPPPPAAAASPAAAGRRRRSAPAPSPARAQWPARRSTADRRFRAPPPPPPPPTPNAWSPGARCCWAVPALNFFSPTFCHFSPNPPQLFSKSPINFLLTLNPKT